MTQYNMNRFLHMWRERTLEEDVTWRGYAITSFLLAVPKPDVFIAAALKALGLNYAGEHGVSQFAKLYEVRHTEARFLLAAWWVWSRLASGRRLRGVQKRPAGGPLEGAAATTLAEEPPAGL